MEINPLFKIALEAYKRGDLTYAETHCLEVLSQEPENALANNLLGMIALRVNNLELAKTFIHEASRVEPNNAEFIYNLSILYDLSNNDDLSIYFAKQAKSLKQSDISYAKYLGKLLTKKGYFNEAIDTYRSILVTHKQDIDISLELAKLLLEMRDYDGARKVCLEAINVNPESIDLLVFNGRVLMLQGKADDAIEHFEKAIMIDGNNVFAEWFYYLCLPIVYKDDQQRIYYRNRFINGLNYLEERIYAKLDQYKTEYLRVLDSLPNFYITYQGEDDLELQRKYASLVQQIVIENYPEYTEQSQTQIKTINERIRIGMISHYLCRNTCGLLFKGWVSNYDTSRFEVYGYHLGIIFDDITEEYSKQFTSFRHIPSSIDSIIQQIRDDNLDILIYLDIGIHARATILAALRLAPIQCVAWAQPITTGLTTIDYFISSELMEPVDGENYYSEQLVKLPNIGIYYRKPEYPNQSVYKEDLGISPDTCIYLACQSLYKYLPNHDFIFPSIVRKVDNAKIIFIEHYSEHVTSVFLMRLKRIFAHYNLDFNDYCIFLPRQNHQGFIDLLRLSDVYLDSISWSGGHTTIEAVACDLPIVTLPGRFMRGRHTYGILKMLQINETIARDETDYIQIGIRLGNDSKFRIEIQKKVHQNKHILFEDEKSLNGLYHFFRSIINP